MKVCCPIPSNSLIFAEFFPELALCPLTQLKDRQPLCQVNDTLSALEYVSVWTWVLALQ